MNNLLTSRAENALGSLLTAVDAAVGAVVPGATSEPVTGEVTLSEVYTINNVQLKAVIKVTVSQI